MSNRSSAWLAASIRLVVLGVLLLGCSDPTGPRRELVPGIIFTTAPGDPRVSFQVDGRTVTVNVVSYGNGCRAKGELRVEVAESPAYISVSVFDWMTFADFCSDVLYVFEHSTTLEIEHDGRWFIAVIGEDSTGHPVVSPYIVTVEAGS